MSYLNIKITVFLQIEEPHRIEVNVVDKNNYSKNEVGKYNDIV